MRSIARGLFKIDSSLPSRIRNAEHKERQEKVDRITESIKLTLDYDQRRTVGAEEYIANEKNCHMKIVGLKPGVISIPYRVGTMVMK